MGPRTDRRHLQGEESRRRILDAVIQIAAERGYEGTTVAQVSRQSGLPASSIYWHFKDKDDLIAAVIRRTHDEWIAALGPLPVLDSGATRRDLLRVIVHHEVVALVEHPDFLRFGLMLALEQRPEEPTARALFIEMRRQSLERMAAGLRLVLTSTGDDRDTFAMTLARLIMASVDGLFIASRESKDGLDIAPHLDLLADSIDLLIEDQMR